MPFSYTRLWCTHDTRINRIEKIVELENVLCQIRFVRKGGISLFSLKYLWPARGRVNFSAFHFCEKTIRRLGCAKLANLIVGTVPEDTKRRESIRRRICTTICGGVLELPFKTVLCYKPANNRQFKITQFDIRANSEMGCRSKPAKYGFMCWFVRYKSAIPHQYVFLDTKKYRIAVQEALPKKSVRKWKMIAGRQ